MIRKSILLFALVIAIITSCSDHHSSKNLNKSIVSCDPDSIRKNERSFSVNDFNSTAYFIFRGEPMGFTFDLLKSFPDEESHELTFGNLRKISRYDDLIRRSSVIINWDWRLLASLIYQESNFDPTVESYRGAFGLMQIMPDTGKNFGIDNTSSPENNLKAGIRYIIWLHSIFDPRISDEKERISFILAAYNAGPGHVLDAMKLAEKNDMNPYIWDGSVATWLLKKSERQFYNDNVVKNGYFRGTESVHFVSQVLERFEHYKSIIPEEKNRPF